MAIATELGDLLIEDCTPALRGERSYMPRSSTATRTFQLRPEAGLGIDDARMFAAAKALVGTNILRTDTIAGPVDRYWIERVMPDRMPNVVDGDLNPTNDLGPRCYGVGRVWPMTSYAANDDSTGWPVHNEGVYVQARYDTHPYFHEPDDNHLPISGPLAATGGSPARPDEGYYLGTVGWRSSRFISKDEQPASRTLTLPGGMLLYSDIYIAANTPIKHGIPYAQYKSKIKYTWHMVPVEAIPQEAIAKAAGRVNSGIFDAYPAGTLLYLSTGIVRYQGPLFDWLADITHEFAFMPNYDDINALAKYYGGWNSVPALVDTGAGAKRIRQAKISADGNAPSGGNAPFQSYDFAYLFRPPNA